MIEYLTMTVGLLHDGKSPKMDLSSMSPTELRAAIFTVITVTLLIFVGLTLWAKRIVYATLVLFVRALSQMIDEQRQQQHTE
jgi:hypothetical protein